MNTDEHRDKDVLLAHIRNCQLIDLYKNPKQLTASQQRRFNQLLKKYKQGWPIAYLVGHSEFMSLDFNVNRYVLIPRPETELVVEETLKLIVQIANSERQKAITVMDIGTGSGNIAVPVAKYYYAPCFRKDSSFPHLQSESSRKGGTLTIYASDISKKALKIARHNTRYHQVSKYIRFCYGNLFSAFPESLKGKTDIIISNPPYVSPTEYRILPRSVREYEPRRALWAGQNGLEFYRRIVDSAPEYLKPGGHLIMEMGYRQAKAVREILARNGSFGKIRTIKDYQGIERIIVTTKSTKFTKGTPGALWSLCPLW